MQLIRVVFSYRGEAFQPSNVFEMHSGHAVIPMMLAFYYFMVEMCFFFKTTDTIDIEFAALDKV